MVYILYANFWISRCGCQTVQVCTFTITCKVELARAEGTI